MGVGKSGSTYTAHREALNNVSAHSYNSQNPQAALLSVIATISD